MLRQKHFRLLGHLGRMEALRHGRLDDVKNVFNVLIRNGLVQTPIVVATKHLYANFLTKAAKQAIFLVRRQCFFSSQPSRQNCSQTSSESCLELLATHWMGEKHDLSHLKHRFFAALIEWNEKDLR